MQHVDNLAVGRHGTPGGEDDCQDGGDADQAEHHQARQDNGAGHGIELLAPGSVRIERGALDGGQVAGEFFDIGIDRVTQLHHDQAGDFDGAEIEPGAKPGLDQLLAFLDA